MAKTIADVPITETEVSPPGPLSLRILRGAGWTLIWFGLLTLGFVVHQVYVTTWFAQQEQGDLDDERLAYFEQAQVQRVLVDSSGKPILDEESGLPIPADPSDASNPGGSTTGTPTTAGSGSGSTDPGLAMLIESPPNRGAAFASITIPDQPNLENGWNVVEGVNLRQLRRGAGHMPWTPLPGQVGNSVISGHRTTHGAPFHDFNKLEVGQRIEIETAIGTHVYEVRKVQIVKPSALWVTAQDGPARAGLEGGDRGAWLTLTTCHPKFSARQRLIVFAEMIDGPNYQSIARLTG